MPPSSLTGLLATGGRKAMPQEIKQITAPAKAGDLVKVRLYRPKMLLLFTQLLRETAVFHKLAGESCAMRGQ